MKKTVLVTGACVNTGVAIVEKFASEGYDVVFTGRNEDKVRIAEANYRKAFPESEIHGFVLNSLTPEEKADAQAVRDFFAMLDSRGIFVQTLVLNAADQGLGMKIFESDPADLDRVLQTNVVWNYCMAEQAALRREYIEAYKASLRAQLDNTYVVTPDGKKKPLKSKKKL